MRQIAGQKLRARTRQQLLHLVAAELSPGSLLRQRGRLTAASVLNDVAARLVGDQLVGAGQARQVEGILEQLGLSYDPYWDSDEWRDGVSGAATDRALSRMWCAARAVPRCFLINVSDAEAGARWETDPTSHYRYDDHVTGRGPLNQAGPGSRVIYYATSSASVSPQHFVASARVTYIDGKPQGPWDARLADYDSFAVPVPKSSLDLPGWNVQHAITEIAPETFDELILAGRGSAARLRPGSEVRDPGPAVVLIDDAAEDAVVARLCVDFPATAHATRLHVPEPLEDARVHVAPIVPREYSDGAREPQERISISAPNRYSSPARDKVAETRAIDIAVESLTKSGWALTRDCQDDGVGYDLEFVRGERLLKVEVKGIQGSRLQFNLTPKERWRAATDRDWVVVAVTRVLSPRGFRAVLVTRDRVAAAPTVVTGYRVNVEQGDNLP